MRILIYGAGSVGLYLSARLAQAEHDVTLKARGETLERASHGTPITLLTDEQNHSVGSVSVVGDIDQSADPYDLAIVATKAWQVSEAAAEIAPVLSSESRILTTQNGVDAPANAAQHVPEDQILAGSVVVIVQRTEALTVALTGSEAAFMVGSLQRTAADDADRRAASALMQARMLAHWNEDILTALWKKLALVASYGGVGALSGVPVGIARAVPQTKALVRHAMQEAFNVGNARGANLAEQDLEDIMGTFTQKFTEGTTASMQRDLLEGRPSELREQVGAVVAHARELGIDVPIYETIYASQLPRELQARAAAGRT